MAVGSFFFSAAPTAQNNPELHFHFINSFIQPSLVGSLVGSLIVMILIGNKNPGRSNTAPQRILPAAALRLKLKMNRAKNFQIYFFACCDWQKIASSNVRYTDKRTDVWSRDFIIWKINSGLWAAGLDSGKKWSGPIMSNFWGPFFHFFGVKKCFLKFFENTIASALKSYIIIL